jgi:hypothetical protein
LRQQVAGREHVTHIMEHSKAGRGTYRFLSIFL